MRALLLALLLPVTLVAQPLPSETLAYAAALDRTDPDVAPSYIGTYISDDATLHVARSGRALVLTLVGQDAFDAFAAVEANRTFNVRAEALLRDAFDGAANRLAAALPTHRRAAGTRDFTRLLTTLTDRLGDVTFVRALGTTDEAHGFIATFVRVGFANGEELLKLRWRDGNLALITRGVLPQVTARPVQGSDHRFAVLDAEGAPRTILAFRDRSVTARGAAHTLVATRTH